jgi:hypothetical protein
MALTAKRDMEQRSVEVNRLELIKVLETNREVHLREYEEAMSGYTAILLAKIDEAFEEAKKTLEDKHEKMKRRVAAFTDEDIARQRDRFTLIDEIEVEMSVPRSYAKEYDAAIDIAKWDVRETLELSYAEFTCFVRDQWDWKLEFEAVSRLYKASH